MGVDFFSILLGGQDSFIISGGQEQGIGNKDHDFTFELGYGYSF